MAVAAAHPTKGGIAYLLVIAANLLDLQDASAVNEILQTIQVTDPLP